jgi:hypothetical protein
LHFSCALSQYGRGRLSIRLPDVMKTFQLLVV